MLTYQAMNGISDDRSLLSDCMMLMLWHMHLFMAIFDVAYLRHDVVNFTIFIVFISKREQFYHKYDFNWLTKLNSLVRSFQLVLTSLVLYASDLGLICCCKLMVCNLRIKNFFYYWGSVNILKIIGIVFTLS